MISHLGKIENQKFELNVCRQTEYSIHPATRISNNTYQTKQLQL